MWADRPNHFDNFCFAVRQLGLQDVIKSLWIPVEKISGQSLREQFDIGELQGGARPMSL